MIHGMVPNMYGMLRAQDARMVHVMALVHILNIEIKQKSVKENCIVDIFTKIDSHQCSRAVVVLHIV